MPRAWMFIVLIVVVGAPAAHADPILKKFKAQISAALAIGNAEKRTAAVRSLFYRGDLDEWSEKLAERTAARLAKLQGRDVSFAPLEATSETLHVINGYEYRPNLEPIGYVVFTDPAAAPGNNTKVFYGRPNKDRGYYLPLTVRRLVNPDAPPDKQLQMIAIGLAHPPLTFEGWCDIALSNNTVKRLPLDDQNIGNQTRIIRGQSIERCEVENTAGRGSLSLRLYEGDQLIFQRQVDSPEATIRYRKQ